MQLKWYIQYLGIIIPQKFLLFYLWKLQIKLFPIAGKESLEVKPMKIFGILNQMNWYKYSLVA